MAQHLSSLSYQLRASDSGTDASVVLGVTVNVGSFLLDEAGFDSLMSTILSDVLSTLPGVDTTNATKSVAYQDDEFIP